MEPKLARLPGTVPVELSQWLIRDEAFEGQMARLDTLLQTSRDAIAALDNIDDPSTELLEVVLAQVALDEDYRVGTGEVVRPDGVTVDLGDDHPAVIARRLVQEDLLIHEMSGDVHALKGGVLAFPASWSLEEKLGRSLVGIHEPVVPYSDDVARRVQRLFDGIRPGRPLMRANHLTYRDAELFQPRREDNRRKTDGPSFMRVERQCLLKLPRTGAVVFSIHTYVVPLSQLDPAALAALPGEGQP